MFRVLLTLLWALALPAHCAQIYGYVEHARLQPGNMIVKAKLDTGARSASLDASQIEIIEKNGKEWVKFVVPLPDEDVKLQRELVRYVRIKLRASERRKHALKRTVKRPVITMLITLGQTTREVEINLTNRRNFKYPLLLGRKALIAFGIAVDPAKTFVSKLTKL